MKKIFLLGVLFCLSFCAMSQTTTFVTVNGLSLPMNNLVMKDSLYAGKINYMASFTIPATNDPSLPIILNALQKGNANISLFYTMYGTAITERKYSNSTVLDLQFTELDGSVNSRATAKIKVSISSSQVVEIENSKFDFKANASRAIMISNYSVNIENIPANRIMGVSEFPLKNNVQISFRISSSDIKAWKEWFSKKGKKLNGNIILLGPNLRDRLLQFNLANIELISLTQNITSDNRIGQPFTAVVNVGNVIIINDK